MGTTDGPTTDARPSEDVTTTKSPTATCTSGVLIRHQAIGLRCAAFGNRTRRARRQTMTPASRAAHEPGAATTAMQQATRKPNVSTAAAVPSHSL